MSLSLTKESSWLIPGIAVGGCVKYTKSQGEGGEEQSLQTSEPKLRLHLP